MIFREVRLKTAFSFLASDLRPYSQEFTINLSKT